jgi:hypothetical protein
LLLKQLHHPNWIQTKGKTNQSVDDEEQVVIDNPAPTARRYSRLFVQAWLLEFSQILLLRVSVGTLQRSQKGVKVIEDTRKVGLTTENYIFLWLDWQSLECGARAPLWPKRRQAGALQRACSRTSWMILFAAALLIRN